MARLQEDVLISETQRLWQLAEDKLFNNPGYKLALALSSFSYPKGQGDGTLFKNEFGHSLRAVFANSADGGVLLIHDPERSNAIALVRKFKAESSVQYWAWPNTKERVYSADDTEAVKQVEFFLGGNFPRTSKQTFSK